ncbi:MAG: right-handed parallel beta-helix repeat-containing protein [Clostridia bacterium]|nr:right-handed parallel beta-helix repeat-containing protein [Clostridia bacterium]
MSFWDHLNKYTPKPYPIVEGDFHVAVNGSDGADGSAAHPFATVGRAVQAVRAVKDERRGVTVCVHAGEYHTDGIALAGADSGSAECPIVYRAYGDGEVVLNGGVTLKAADFRPVSEDVRARLRGEAKDRVVCVDLKRYGLSEADWGPVYPIGAFGTEKKYDSFQPGENCELFVNGNRMTLARYPNEGFLKLAAVADVGDCFEFPEQNYYYDWHGRRNHAGGKYLMDKETTARLKTWKSLDGVWAYGYFYHDWADSSTPIRSFDLEHRAFFPEYVAHYGARKGALYFFYNVLDELDAPGEWYLDRAGGTLYLYPPVPLESARVELTITQHSVISAVDVSHVTFEGFTIKGTRGDAVTIRGDDNTVRRLTVYGVMGNAVVAEGRRNLVTECDISHTGRGGIRLAGGDRNTLEPGGNRADNNLIHDWAEVYMTYNPAVRLDGVGNVCSHNEIFNSPHSAIFYYGNDHLVEYNVIHDVVLHSSDAGAIYSGQDWSGQGCVVRYNCLCRAGGGEFTPDGIYFDDMLSGQSAYGNLVIDVKKNGFLIGGGRDNRITDNVVVNCGTGIKYDDRGRDAFVGNGWARAAVIDYETGSMWKRLRAVPYRSAAWAERYPALARVSLDFNDPDNPDFPVNPANSVVKDNIVIDAGGELGVIQPDVARFSEVSGNAVFASEEEAGFVPGEYVLKDGAPALKAAPGFKNLPIGKMGRY